MRNEYAKFVLGKKIFYSKKINVGLIFNFRLIFFVNNSIQSKC